MTTATLAEMVGAPVEIGGQKFAQITVAQAAELQQRWATEERAAMVRRLDDAGIVDPQKRYDMLAELDRECTKPEWFYQQLRSLRSGEVLTAVGAQDVVRFGYGGITAAMQLCGIVFTDAAPGEAESNGSEPDPK